MMKLGMVSFPQLKFEILTVGRDCSATKILSFSAMMFPRGRCQGPNTLTIILYNITRRHARIGKDRVEFRYIGRHPCTFVHEFNVEDRDDNTGWYRI